MGTRSPKHRSANYLVGKGRPPEATRWKPGQSGNPSGRPKGAKNALTFFHEALKQPLDIHENGRVRKITAREGIIRRLINQALKGDLKAIAFVLAKEPEVARSIEAQEVKMITSNMTAQEAAKIYADMIKWNPPPASLRR